MSNQVYKKGQIVWAKVRGFPWWPAVVNESNKKKNVIDKNVSLFFLAENTIGSVPVHKLLDYEANFEQLSGTKNKKLQEAVKIACDRYGDPRKTKNMSNTSENTNEAQMVGEAQDEKQKDIVRQDTSISEIAEEDPNQVKDEEIDKRRKTETKGKKEEGSKFEQKQKMKRDAKNFKFTGSIDMLQRRSTRSQARNDNLEMFTEPLIYFSNKSNRHDSEGYSDEEFASEDGEGEQGKKSQSNLGKRSLEDDDDNGFYHANNNEQEETNNKNSNRGKKKVKIQDTTTEKKNQKNKENFNKEQRNSISELLGKGSELRELNLSKGYQNQSTKYVGPVRASSPYNNTIYHSSSLIAQNSFNNIKAILNSSNQSSNKHLRNFDLGKIEIVVPLQTNDTYHLRKNVCQKLASVLQDGYPIDKDSAQELTLFVEGRINSYFGNDTNYYKKIMKILYKLIKVKAITVEELRDIIVINFEDFQVLLQNKVQDALSLKKVKPLVEPELTQHSVNNSTESPNTSNNTPPEDIILENIEIPIVAENIIQESSLPEPISESSEEKALKEGEQYQESLLKSREHFEKKDLKENIQDQELIQESAEIIEREFIGEVVQKHEDALKSAEKLEEEHFQEDLQNQTNNFESEEKALQDDENILKSDQRIEEEYSKEEVENDKNILEDDEKVEEDIPKEAFHEITFNDEENIEEKALSL